MHHQNKVRSSVVSAFALGASFALQACALSADPAPNEEIAQSPSAIVGRPCPIFPVVSACYWVENLNDSGPGSFRQAIEDANRGTAPIRRIKFDLPNALSILHPNSPYPQINGDVRIEGFSQPGSAPGTETTPPIVGVAIDCANCGISGLRLSGTSNFVSGIAIYNVPRGSGIVLLGSGHTIVGTTLGTLYTPTLGWLSLPNSQAGLNMNASDGNTIGGLAIADRNTFSGNGVEGIIVAGNGNQILNNAIGTDFLGELAIPNQGDGIFVYGDDNSIGGIGEGEGNRIAYNGVNGVNVVRGSGNKISRNFIHDNVKLGIDLDNDGHTPNDGRLDLDEGPNGRQNFPRITSVTRDARDVPTISLFLNSKPARQYRAEIFKSSDCGSGNAGQGRNFIGSIIMHTDGEGRASFVITSFNTLVHAGEYLTATAVDMTDKSTSEFSRCFLVE